MILQLRFCLAASTSNSFCHLHLSRRLTLDHDLASVVYAWVCCFLTRLERCIIPGQQQRTLQQIPSANQVTVTTPTISSISAVTPTRLISEIQGLGTSGSCTEHPGDCVVFCSTHRCQRLSYCQIFMVKEKMVCKAHRTGNFHVLVQNCELSSENKLSQISLLPAEVYI